MAARLFCGLYILSHDILTKKMLYNNLNPPVKTADFIYGIFDGNKM